MYKILRRSFAAVLRSPPPPRLHGQSLRPLQARVPVGSIILGAAALGGAAYFGQDLLGSSPSKTSLPRLPITVESLNLQSATEKLRAEEHTSYFDAGNGRRGQVFRIRLQSNSPTEDEFVAAEAQGQGGQALSFWGVFDGHAGWATSAVLKQLLVPYVSAHLKAVRADSSTETLMSTVKRAFVALDDRILSEAKAGLSAPSATSSTVAALAAATAGSCALLAIFNPSSSQLLTACVGDSRAVLGRLESESPTTTRSWTTHPLSDDQTGRQPSERERILALHPDEPNCVDPVTGRVLGLAVTRAFGDARWKWDAATLTKAQTSFFGQKPRPGARVPPPYLTAEPVVTEATVGSGDFVVLASDGLWDHMRSEDAIGCVARWLDTVREGRLGVAVPGQKGAYKPVSVRDEGDSTYGLEEGTFATWDAKERDWVVEDDNVATHLVRNALGGRRRTLFNGVMTTYPPVSRNVRDDITVLVVFFDDVVSGQ